MTTQDHNVLCWIFCNLGTCYNSVMWPRKPTQSLKTQKQISFYIARLGLLCSSKTHDSQMTCVSFSETNWYPVCSKCLNINWWYSFYSKVEPAELSNYRAISKSEADLFFQIWWCCVFLLRLSVIWTEVGQLAQRKHTQNLQISNRKVPSKRWDNFYIDA